MKLLIGLVFALCAFQVHAQNHSVDYFRNAIDYRFTRLQAFYDATNNAMRIYRIAHVHLINEIMNGMMQVFGEDIEYVRISRGYVNTVIADVLAQLGGQPNACLNSVMSRLVQNSNTLGRDFNACSQRANRTITTSLNEGFYPTFAEVQLQTSTIPLMTLNALSRGNVFDDNFEILSFLQAQYDAKIMQWLSAVSQLFRWDTERFEVEGLFYKDEMLECTVDPIYYYSNTNTVLMFEAYDNCRP